MDEVELALTYKHGDGPDGATRRLHRRSGYVSPDAYYEAALLRLVRAGTRWLDVGCGRSPCPANPRLAAELARRCAWMVGVDPGPNLAANPYLRSAIAGDIAAATPDGYTLVTMRMVAEHVADPVAAAAALRALVSPGGTLLIYTVDAVSPSAIIGRFAGRAAHVALMRWLFRGEMHDVFPAYYRMNTPRRLRRILEGFEVQSVVSIDDCRLTQRWPWLNAVELALWRALQSMGWRYPERCILAECRRLPEPWGCPRA